MAFSSDAPVTVPLKKYDVFISFRGEDTRTGFTSHLHSALRRSYIQTYIDYRIEKGKEVWGELEKAIKESTLFLVVFSEDYASSTWCLNELVEIMECHKNGQDVIPVFYHIDPSHVRKQTGSYHTSLAEHKKHGNEKLRKWKDALRETASLSGFHSSKYGTESDLIEDITKDVLAKLDHEYKEELTCDFIPNENYSRIESLMKIESREVQIIGLWGMGGIGKTTLAAAIFHKVSSQYEGSCFLENVTEESNKNGINNTCKRLLSKLLRDKDLGIDTPKVIPSMIMRRLKRMKVFVVLDDIHTSELLQNLIVVGRGRLGDGSKVIVTTRDKKVLQEGGVDEIHIHEVKEMNSQNSLRLFSLNAFNKVLPKEGYVELSKRAIDYAKGNALALKVLGSFLRYKSEIEWDSALAKLKEVPNADIQRVLRWSYHELNDDKEKNIFLDIACFFKGQEREEVTKILNVCGFFADIGIKNLLDKALIRVDSKNCIQMHDLIQEMGKQIVREESPTNPGQRSRLWDHKEVCDVLTNNRGTKAVEAILLEATQMQITCINIHRKALKKMPNLRLLAFSELKGNKYVFLPKGLDSLPESLRYLLWDGYPLKSLPYIFRLEMLLQLFLRRSNVENLWNGVQNLPNLERLDLTGSKRLTKCPNVSGAPNLKWVKLSYCVRLPFVDPSIFSLQKLEFLILDGCISLKSLSSNNCPPSLRELHAQGCINLQEFSIALMRSIKRLRLGRWGLNELPSSILHIKNLQNFSFPISDNLVDLPENFARTISLLGPLEGERDTSITLRKVLSSPAFLSVKSLLIVSCDSLSEITDDISLLSSLENLTLMNIAIRSLPKTMKYLPQLKRLAVVRCKMLRSIPELPQSIKSFGVWKCESLEVVSSSVIEQPLLKYWSRFLLPNCLKLDPSSCDSILENVLARIELRARLHSATLENVQYFILCFLPANSSSSSIRDRFPCHSTQALFTVELPPNLIGFVYYLVLSKGPMEFGVGFGCECYLETSSGEWITITTSFVRGELFWMSKYFDALDIMSDHVLLWYDAQCCEKIMEAVEQRRKAIDDVSTSYNPKLTFRFFIDETPYNEVAIKECGFRWIYPSENQIVVEEGDIHESENSSVQNRTDRLETKDLRCSLEELLHIGFGGDLMNEEIKIATDEPCIWEPMNDERSRI